MARLKKKIVSPGLYRITDLATGRVREELVTPERIQHWATEGTRYLKAGNQLPAPWSHVDPATGLPVMVSANGMLPRSDINGGFWDTLTTEFDPEEGLTLTGIVDAPGDENDPNTPAGKVGKTVRETSIFTLPYWKDGKGNEFRDVPVHVALVTHAIQPNQKNFEKVPEGALAIAMSHRALAFKPVAMASPPSGVQVATDPNAAGGQMGDGQAGGKPGGQSYGGGNGQSSPTNNASGADITQVIAALRQCGIDLPDDTTPMNIWERLLVACRQKSVSEGNQGGDLYQSPEGAVTQQPAPVAMSQNPPAAPAAFDFSKVTMEVFMSHPAAKQLVDANNTLQAIVVDQAKAGLQLRIKKLIDGGTITQKYADEILKPMLDGFAMSHINKPNAVEATLGAIEAVAATRQPAPVNNAANQALMMNLGNYDPAMLAMSNPAMPAQRQTIDNPFIQANGQPNNAGINPQGGSAPATDIIKDFFDATGGVAAHFAD